MKFKLILFYIRSCFISNIFISLLIAMLLSIFPSINSESNLFMVLLFNLSINIASFGYLASLGLSLYFTRGEWFIYYNHSISRPMLFGFYFAFCLSISTILILLGSVIK